MVKISQFKNYSNVSLPAKMEKIYFMHKLVGLQLFKSGTRTFSIGTTFCQMGVLNSCVQNPSESSVLSRVYEEILCRHFLGKMILTPWLLDSLPQQRY